MLKYAWYAAELVACRETFFNANQLIFPHDVQEEEEVHV